MGRSGSRSSDRIRALNAEGELAAGTLLGGRYRIERRIGHGSMGIVYAADHIPLGRKVALKVLSSRHAGDPVYLGRFRREARTASQARHPNIVDVIDLGNADGHEYFSMELLEGLDLYRAIRLKGVYDPVEMIPIVDQVLAALVAAHGLGLIHRDLKPENVYLAQKADRVLVKLLDFGVVKVLAEGAQAHLTRTGTVVGTPEYMAPEQAVGGAVDARADLYAVGCLVYEMLCSRPPFVGRSVFLVMTAQVHDAPTPPSHLRPALPEAAAIDRFVMRALEKDPDKRYAGAADMRAALGQLARELGAPDAAHRPVVLPTAPEPGGEREHGRRHPSSPPEADTVPRQARVEPTERAGDPWSADTGRTPRRRKRGSRILLALAALAGAAVAGIATYLAMRG